MSSSGPTTSPAAQTCSVCGASSMWHDAFTKQRDGTLPLLCCPRCAERQSRKSARLSLGAMACAVLLSVAVHARGGGGAIEGFFIFSILFVAVQYPLVLLHELGHAVAARAMRAPAYAILVGREPWLVDRDFAGIRWRIGKFAGGGLTYHDYLGGSGARTRGIIITAAGPATNLLVSAVVFAIAVALPGTFSESFAKAALAVIALASLAQFVVATWPHTVNTSAGRLPNDGAKILGYLRGAFDKAEPAIAVKYMMLASFAFSDEEFAESARKARASRLAWNDADFGAAMTAMEAAALCESDDAPAAVALLRPLQATELRNPGVRAGVLDNLGWAYFLVDEPEWLDEGVGLVAEACAIAPWEASYSISLACLLAASATRDNGRATEARAILSRWEPRELSRQCAAYAALAHGLIAAAEQEFSEARRQQHRARELRATPAPLRVLERRLASG